MDLGKKDETQQLRDRWGTRISEQFIREEGTANNSNAHLERLSVTKRGLRTRIRYPVTLTCQEGLGTTGKSLKLEVLGGLVDIRSGELDV